MVSTDLRQRFVDTRARWTDIQGHLDYLAEAVIDVDARAVLELGVREGVSTIALLYGLLVTGGHLWSVDTDEHQLVGTYPHWTFLVADDRSPTARAATPLALDLLFIDTSHEYDHTLTELRTYAPRVRPGGRVLLHDTDWDAREGGLPEPYPVRRALDAYCAETDQTWVNREGSYGLGVIQR
jgi:predicted O-methyltransferase YrrM